MRGRVGLVAVALVTAAICMQLGRWQLERLDQRRARNAAIAARRAAPPLELGGRLPADSVWQRRVRAHGVLDYAHERVWPGRTMHGVPGVALLTPLRLADGSAVFVDRGWVPSADGRHVDLARTRERDTVTVAALGVRAPRGPGDADPVALADSLPYALAPFTLQWLPDGATFSVSPLPVRRWAAPALDDGPHLAYALQWFAFAVIAIGGALALLRTAQRGGTRQRGSPLDTAKPSD